MRIGAGDVPVLNDSPSHFCGIYAIVNGATGQSYIGSSVSVLARFNSHKRHLNDTMRTGLSHTNAALQRDWDIYGEDIFDFVLLEACPVSLLSGREQEWMDVIGRDYLYNKRKANDTGRRLDRAFAADVRELKSAGHTNEAVATLLGLTEREIVRVVAAAYNE